MKLYEVIMRRSLTLIFILILLQCSCRTGNPDGEKPQKPGRNEMAEMNRFLVQKDREIIQNYIERKGLAMQESPAGLWYVIEEEGKGDLLKDNDRIEIAYRCELIDGTFCYSSDESGLMRVTVGKSDIEPGLNEGLRLLKPGGKAIFILPPFLAHGLVGDGKKIPPRTIVVYWVTVVGYE